MLYLFFGAWCNIVANVLGKCWTWGRVIAALRGVENSKNTSALKLIGTVHAMWCCQATQSSFTPVRSNIEIIIMMLALVILPTFVITILRIHGKTRPYQESKMVWECHSINTAIFISIFSALVC